MRLIDPDNLTPKYIIDSCQYARHSRGDSAGDVEIQTSQRIPKPGEEEATLITITPLRPLIPPNPCRCPSPPPRSNMPANGPTPSLRRGTYLGRGLQGATYARFERMHTCELSAEIQAIAIKNMGIQFLATFATISATRATEAGRDARGSWRQVRDPARCPRGER